MRKARTGPKGNSPASTFFLGKIYYRNFDPDVAEILGDLLNDPKTINEIVKEDLLTEYLEEIKKRVSERYIT